MIAMAELKLMRLVEGLGQNKLRDKAEVSTRQHYQQQVATFLMATISKTMQTTLTRSPTMMGSAFSGWTRLQRRQEINTRLMKRYPWCK